MRAAEGMDGTLQLQRRLKLELVVWLSGEAAEADGDGRGRVYAGAAGARGDDAREPIL